MPAPDDGERSMLECVLDGAENSRLTCQLNVTADMDGLVVRLPKSQFWNLDARRVLSLGLLPLCLLQDSTMKIIADQNKWCGHARCATVDETLFPLDDNGYIAIAEMPVPAGMETPARRGVRACRERALTLIEGEPAVVPAA